MSDEQSQSLTGLAGQARVAPTKRERIAALGRLGHDCRLATYRRGELDFEACCLWAARYPHEVPGLQGEFEFLIRWAPEVCE